MYISPFLTLSLYLFVERFLTFNYAISFFKVLLFIGIRSLLVEVDSLCGIQLVASYSVLINDILLIHLFYPELLKREWRFDIKYIFREVNFAPDTLAKYAHALFVGLYIFNFSPISLSITFFFTICIGWFIPILFYLNFFWRVPM